MLKYLLILMIPVMSMNSFVQAVTNNIWGESYAMGGVVACMIRLLY